MVAPATETIVEATIGQDTAGISMDYTSWFFPDPALYKSLLTYYRGWSSILDPTSNSAMLGTEHSGRVDPGVGYIF